LRRCRSDKADRDPKEESLSNAYPAATAIGSVPNWIEHRIVIQARQEGPQTFDCSWSFS
jgi:hypothetical protein